MKRFASLDELRSICHEPVRSRNDVSGALYGQRLSIHVTRLFLALGLSPSFASSLMLVFGVVGSGLLLLPGWWRVAGLVILVAAYVLDCVDGEMARYQRIDSLRWAAFDLVHHLVVKGLTFLCLGIGLTLEHGTVWNAAAGGLVAVMWLVLTGVRDVAALLFAKKVVLDDDRTSNPAYQRLQRSVVREEEIRVDAAGAEPLDPWGEHFRMRPWVVRTFFFTFDIVVPLFLAAALVDRFAGPFAAFGTVFSVTEALLGAYAVLLPLHVLDTVVSALRRGGRVRDELIAMTRRVQRFRDLS